MFRPLTQDKHVGQPAAVPDVEPLVETPQRPARVVRWLEWLIVAAFVIGAGALGYVLLRGGDEAEVRNDLFGTRYREAGVVMQVEPGPSSLPDPTDAARLTAMSSAYRSQIAEQ